jgi:hypothetical protein
MEGLGSPSLAAFERACLADTTRALLRHPRVTAVSRIDEGRLKVERDGGLSDLEVVPIEHFDGKYYDGRVDAADVRQILREFPGVRVIVSTSMDRYSSEAKDVALGVGVGLFTLEELAGALEHDGQQLVAYRQ